MAGYYSREPEHEASGEDPYLQRVKGWYREDVAKAARWRKQAREDFRFRDGEQWSSEDRRLLEEQGRPAIVFNRIGVLVDAVVGAEVGNRREVRYIPRESGDSLPNEVLTSAAEWFRDQCDAEDEESAAFKDAITCGMGWTETRLDRATNPDGDPKIEHIDAFEMVWDCNAVKANLVDSRRRWRVRKVDRAQAEKMFPDVDPAELDAAWADVDAGDGEPALNDPASRYAASPEGKDRAPKKVTIVACQYVEDAILHKAAIFSPPMVQPMVVELDEEKFAVAEKAGSVLNSVKVKRERVMQCILGAQLLVKPAPTQTGGFTWNCITGLKDNDKGIFYGVVRRAKDPQRWANKWLSQILHILNSQAKGGVLAERGVFEDDREAEQSWARTDRITYLEKGALSNPNGAKIQPKPMAQFPAGFDRLLQYADEMIVKATGINMELLGMREVNQPGVLEYQRKQSGMGILASFFDSLKRYRKIQGRGMLKLIQDYLSDGRMVRILGADKAQYVPLTREAVADVEYDIIVDDAPTSPNEKERTFQLMMQMLPMFKEALGPDEMAVVAEYSPMPASFVEKVKQAIAARAGAANPAAQAQVQAGQIRVAAEQAKHALEMEKLAVERARMEHEKAIALISQETERIKASAALAAARGTAVGALN
jgi:Phage P22-like portal protein